MTSDFPASQPAQALSSPLSNYVAVVQVGGGGGGGGGGNKTNGKETIQPQTHLVHVQHRRAPPRIL